MSTNERTGASSYLLRIASAQTRISSSVGMPSKLGDEVWGACEPAGVACSAVELLACCISRSIFFALRSEMSIPTEHFASATQSVRPAR